jgi:hypothetical protein
MRRRDLSALYSSGLTLRTTGKTKGLPSLSRYAPTPRLTFLSNESCCGRTAAGPTGDRCGHEAKGSLGPVLEHFQRQIVYAPISSGAGSRPPTQATGRCTRRVAGSPCGRRARRRACRGHEAKGSLGPVLEHFQRQIVYAQSLTLSSDHLRRRDDTVLGECRAVGAKDELRSRLDERRQARDREVVLEHFQRQIVYAQSLTLSSDHLRRPSKSSRPTTRT